MIIIRLGFGLESAKMEGEMVLKIDRIADVRIRVLLNQNDMKTLHMSYPTITWENQKTRDMIQGILEIVERETGFRRRGERMLIEAYEPRRGECGFLFTLLPSNCRSSGRRRFRIVRASTPQLYQFAESEHLLAAIQEIARLKNRRISRSVLFQMEGQYFLVLYPLQKLDPRVDRIFCEFGEKNAYSTYAVAYLEERGKRIAKGDVLSRMAESMATSGQR